MITAPPQKTPGVQPLTIVEKDAHVTIEEMTHRVEKTRAEHGELLQRYHEVWYEAPHTWHMLHFLGVGVMKCPNDLWMLQELLTLNRPRAIIETGTYQGGSALWLAFLQEMLGIDGRVFTVDFEDHRRCTHPRVTFYGANSIDAEFVQELGRDVVHWEEEHGAVGAPRMVILDSDHSAAHVQSELELYAPFVNVGDYLIVEDTNIAWQTDRGARGGLEDYLSAHPNEFRQDLLCERWLLSMHPGGWLQRMAVCTHG